MFFGIKLAVDVLVMNEFGVYWCLACEYRYAVDAARLQLLVDKQAEANERVMAAKQAAAATASVAGAQPKQPKLPPVVSDTQH